MMTTTASPPPQDDRIDWSYLSGDLLACVFQLLGVHGRICFLSVCRSWRAAAEVVRAQDDHDQQRQPPAALMPPPWVVIPDDIGCSDSFTLISVPTQQAIRWTPPGGAGLLCVGSNGGWLAGAYISAADRTVRIALVNPLTNARVELPATGRIRGRAPAAHRKRHSYRSEAELLLCTAVQKVSFSPDPTARSFFVAVVGVTGSRVPASFGVAFARARRPDAAAEEEGWCAYAKIRNFDERGDGGYSCYSDYWVDVAYHDGKFYYMAKSKATDGGQVWVVDMAAPRPSPAPLARFNPTVLGRRSCYREHNYHLTFTGDGALHVVSSTTSVSSEGVPSLNMFAHRYSPNTSSPSSQGGGGGSSSAPWTKVRCLPGQAFLVGDWNQTLCVPAGGGCGAWLRPDSVYFTGVTVCSSSLLANFRGLRVWTFNLATGCTERPTYCSRKVRWRPIESWRQAEVDDLLRKEEEEARNRFHFGLNWSQAIWFMPSKR